MRGHAPWDPTCTSIAQKCRQAARRRSGASSLGEDPIESHRHEVPLACGAIMSRRMRIGLAPMCLAYQAQLTNRCPVFESSFNQFVATKLR